MAGSWSAPELAALFGIGATVVAVSVPEFLRNLSASKLTEPVDGLGRLSASALAYAEEKPQEISFPPPAPLTPAEVPRGVLVLDPPHTWEHLTWRSLRFRFDHPHAFSFEFRSTTDPATGAMQFTASAHGDLDGDGTTSTFEVGGIREPGRPPRMLPGMFIDREVE